jgi:hypothetical protein
MEHAACHGYYEGVFGYVHVVYAFGEVVGVLVGGGGAGVPEAEGSVPGTCY